MLCDYVYHFNSVFNWHSFLIPIYKYKTFTHCIKLTLFFKRCNNYDITEKNKTLDEGPYVIWSNICPQFLNGIISKTNLHSTLYVGCLSH